MPRIFAKPDLSSHPRRWTLRRNMLATGFLAVEFAVVGSLIRTTTMDWYANLLVGVLTTGYLITVYLVIVQPEA
jgi:hypothetical protein